MEITELLKQYDEERRRRWDVALDNLGRGAIDKLFSTATASSALQAQSAIEAALGPVRLSASNALRSLAEQQRQTHSAASQALAGFAHQAISQHVGTAARLVFEAASAGAAARAAAGGALAQAAAVKAIADSQNSLSAFTAMGARAALAALRADTGPITFDHLEALRDEIEALRGSFAWQVADEMQAAIRPEENTQRAVERIEQLFDNKIASLPRSRISAQGLANILQLLSMLLTLLIAVQQSRESAATSEAQFRQLADLRAAVERAVVNTERLLPAEDRQIYYLVQREVKLRTGARTKSPAVASLSPGEMVRLVHPKHEWIYVEYFDHVEGITKFAWAPKKYFRRIGVR